MKKNVAVIGSSGAIGNAVSKILLDDESVQYVYNFSRSISPNTSDKENAASIELVETDCTDEDGYSQIKTIQDKVFTKKVNSKSNIDAFDELGKIEISEEIDRINSHLEQISQSIKSPQLSGKKINFILQEINRESNTIMSKFLDKRISKSAISLKIQAEKLREQIGNIL